VIVDRKGSDGGFPRQLAVYLEQRFHPKPESCTGSTFFHQFRCRLGQIGLQLLPHLLAPLPEASGVPAVALAYGDETNKQWQVRTPSRRRMGATAKQISDMEYLRFSAIIAFFGAARRPTSESEALLSSSFRFDVCEAAAFEAQAVSSELMGSDWPKSTAKFILGKNESSGFRLSKDVTS